MERPLLNQFHTIITTVLESKVETLLMEKNIKKLMEKTDGMEWDYGFRILQGWSTWFKHLIDISSELVMETPANVFKPEPLGHNIFEPFLEL